MSREVPSSTASMNGESAGDGGYSGPDPPSNSALVAALDDYLAALRDGRAFDRDAFLARYPGLASELLPCLGGLELVMGALGPERPDRASGPGPAPPQILGDFRIIRVLGRGGMGVVYEAEQVSLGRKVALKVLPYASSLDPRQRQRFQVEAQAAAHLQHPRIVPVYAVGEASGIPFYAMQLIDGRTLAEVIQGLREWSDRESAGVAPPPSGENTDSKLRSASGHSGTFSGSNRCREFFEAAARLGAQAAEALDHAHELGIVHRDIKPANLMLDGRGDVWVTDFGLARMPGDLDLTRTGDVLGTLRYMSPEQSRARHGMVDPRTDIYALGATLYELLALHAAFDGRDRQELLRQIALDEPPPLRRANPAVPRDLETIVFKAMAKDPASRYQSARDMADDLQRFLAHKPVLARRPGLLQYAARWTRRHRAVVASAAIAGLVATSASAAVLGMAYQRFVDREREAQALAEERDRDAKRERDHARQMSDLFGLADTLAYSAMGRLSMQDQDPDGGEFYTFALRRYHAMAHSCEGKPELRDVLAGATRRIAFIEMILRYLKKLPEARAFDAIGDYRRAADLYQEVLAEDPSAEGIRQGLIGTLKELQMLLAQQQDWVALVEIGRRVVDVERAWVDRSTGDSASRSTQESQDDLHAHLALIQDLTWLSEGQDRNGHVAGARSTLAEAAERWQALADRSELPAELKSRFEQAGGQILKGLEGAGMVDRAESLRKRLDSSEAGP
ncbi:MAG: serine/threonine-protein kinase [Isosphaeraceae bacterium]